jgi:hypothetical protein
MQEQQIKQPSYYEQIKINYNESLVLLQELKEEKEEK